MELREINELKKSLLNLVTDQNLVQLKELLKNQYSIDIASALSDFEDADLTVLLDLLDSDDIASIIEESDNELQIRIVGLLDSSKTAQVFSHMSTDDIADILGTLSINRRKELLELMREHDASEIQMLLGFEPNTAGGIMTTHYIALRKNLTIKEALQKIKVIGPKTEVIETIFIINLKNELIGTTDLRDILIASDESKLEDITNKNVIFVYPDTDQEEVSLIVSKYDLKALPVVNKKHSILGIITVDDVIDVIVEEPVFVN
ncbi:magnesium transporter mgtE (plasmid) [Peptoclostridium acidaminophilum DSM 3953]|uniref:Magnesium transporter mgtE n=1 Tax=Peptoclostridium acidaminophilum DSM 3953 TaxID=1286171 RepID=W8TNH9_PEPAC|nr:CBS domain-containing protein [Peptoclostridium acidaminophilum]AHM57722.1 magnesium transporter mgtE [Peptoclostridium acidaminophilum DSM 3953]